MPSSNVLASAASPAGDGPVNVDFNFRDEGGKTAVLAVYPYSDTTSQMPKVAAPNCPQSGGPGCASSMPITAQKTISCTTRGLVST